ncbi:MAG: FAD-dependent oxidoreductase, partial [Acidimicrobiales bacterium]
MAFDFDLVVLGAGPGGYTAAVRAAQLGLSTAVVEERYWGGICLNVGCIPSKALLRNAELAQIVKDEAERFGIRSASSITMDYGVAFDRSRSVADGRVKGVHYLMRKNGITELDGRGRFLGPHEIAVDGADGQRTATFANCIVAAGTTTR